jgi:hypothetical protein
MITVTLDTNVILAGLDGSDDERRAFQSLLRLVGHGLIKVAVTSRVHQDKHKDEDLERVKRDYGVFLTMFPVIGAPFRLDVSIVGGPDVWVDTELFSLLDRLFTSRQENTMWDIDHLYGHRAANRDYFLTHDTSILNKVAGLDLLGIQVMSPLIFADAAAEAETLAGGDVSDMADHLAKCLETTFQRELSRMPAPRMRTHSGGST